MNGDDAGKSHPVDQIHNGGWGKGKGKEKPASTISSQNSENVAARLSDDRRPPDASAMSRLANSTLALGSSLLSAPDISSLEVSTSSSESLRSPQVRNHIQREEAAFTQFLEGTDPSAVSGSTPEDVPSTLVDNFPNREGTDLRLQSDAGHRIADSDGLEVVKLLDHGYSEVMLADPAVPMTKDQELRLRQALFREGSSADDTGKHASDWSNLLNFVPEYISNGTSGWGYRELSEHMGTPDTMEASEIWAEQWGDVLSRYTDEVWGDLGALVQEARQEAGRIKSHEGDVGPSGPKAILRLRQILSHIRDEQ
ncbi:Dynamin- GTPase protein [Pestalotiopsis sp. IQ-011]